MPRIVRVRYSAALGRRSFLGSAGGAPYYARVFLEGAQMAWTSPVWVVEAS